MSRTDVAPLLADVLEHLPDPALLLDEDGRVVRASRRARELLGVVPDGSSPELLLGESVGAAVARRLPALHDEDVLPALLVAQGRTYDVHLAPAGAGALLLLRPTDAATALDQLRSLIVSFSGDVEQLGTTLERFCLWVERFQPGILCSILRFDADAQVLRHGAAPSLPQAYNALVDGFPIGPVAGSCGTAVFRQATVIVTDIATDPLWAPYAEQVLPFGIRACWSQPVFASDGSILGTFAVYRRVPGGPSDRERRFIDDAAGILAVVMERARERERLAATTLQLRESESRYRALVEESSDLVALVSADGRFAYVSPSVTTLLGWNPSDAAGRSLADFLHPDDLAQAQSRLMARYAGAPQAANTVFRLRTRDGGYRSMEARGGILAPDGANPAQLLVNLRDITDRLEAEQAVRAAERRLRQLFDHVSEFLFLMQPDGRLVEVGAIAAKVGGYNLADVLGKFAWELPPFPPLPASVTTLRAAVERAAQGETVDGEVAYRSLVGIEKLARFRVTPLTDEAGAVAFILGEGVDITDQRAAERALAESERLFKGIADQSPGLVHLFDLESRRYVYVSAAVERMLGRSPEEVVALGAEATQVLFAPEHREAARAIIDRALDARDDEVLASELTLLHRDGSRRMLETRSVVYRRDDNGRPHLLLSVSSDVTGQRALEQRIRQAEKMQALGTLAGGVAHDFNNLLAVIMGCGELVNDQLAPGTPARDDMSELLAASRRARNLVRQILAFSRKSDLTRETFALTPVLHETLRFLRASLPATVTIRGTIPADLGHVAGDASQVEQVFINLGVNAEYAMRPGGGGTISLTAEPVQLTGTAATDLALLPGPYARIRVHDTGPGIPAAVLSRVFEPFFTTKPVGEGTGLGLSAAHGIVTQHGGAIRVQSSAERGTEFEVLLPLAIASTPEAAALPETPAAAPAKARILVVDDEPAIVRVMQKVLQRFGYAVTATQDPNEALALIREHPEVYDCLITDLTMPRLSGDKLAAAVLAIRPSLPVILCTGYSPDVTAESAGALGVAAYLNKPLEPAELIATLARVLAPRGA